MNLERLFLFLSDIHPISNAFRAAIEQELALLWLPKNHVLLEALRISDQVWFLESGFAMSYIYSERGVQVENFWREGQIILSVTSFCQQIPASENIRLLTSSKTLVVNYHGVRRLLQEFSEAHWIYNTVLTQYYERSRERAREMRYMRAVDRYRKLIADFPGIERFVAQEYIASYLGIAPQSLSRLKRRISKA